MKYFFVELLAVITLQIQVKSHKQFLLKGFTFKTQGICTSKCFIGLAPIKILRLVSSRSEKKYLLR